MKQDSVYIIVCLIYVLVIGYDITNWFRYRNISSKEIKTKRLRSTINFLLTITGCFLVTLSIIYHVNIFNYSAPVAHSDVNQITLRDFKGFKTPGHTLHGEKEFAFIVTSMDYEISDNNITVYALFHPSRSYVYNEKLIDDALLRHELYHFHITEYMVRLLRKELSGHGSIPDRGEIHVLAESYRQKEQEMQREYDEDTYHSYVLSQQKKWENKIDSLLTLHEKYAAPTLSQKNEP